MSIVGRVYYLPKKGLVRILCQWQGKGPRNVLVQYEDWEGNQLGKPFVRPFRGLRKYLPGPGG